MIPEEKRINSRARLKEFLALECARYPMTARHIIPYLFQNSEGAILRRHTVLLRTTEYHVNTGHRLRAFFWRARLMKFQMRYAIHIPLNSCGKGLCIPHVLPVAFNGNATLGEHCRVMPMVLLSGDDKNDLAPTVGDRVTIGIGANLVGGITIADDITIGAGAVVTKSFLEPGITIAGVPAKKLHEQTPADHKEDADAT